MEVVNDEEKNGLSHTGSVELNKSSSLHTSISLTACSYELQNREPDEVAVVEIESGSNQYDTDSKVHMSLISCARLFQILN